VTKKMTLFVKKKTKTKTWDLICPSSGRVECPERVQFHVPMCVRGNGGNAPKVTGAYLTTKSFLIKTNKEICILKARVFHHPCYFYVL
jgi:hypothetical protein